MKATEELKNEHRGVELMLRIIEGVSGKLGRGEKVLPEHLDGIMEFLTIFVDKCHHGKEEEFLFPALERVGGPNDKTLIGELVEEHTQGRVLGAKMNDAVERFRAGDQTASSSFQRAAGEYFALLTEHIEKENSVLFPEADTHLDSSKDNELFEAFERLERERIGEGKHEEFHELLHRLKHEYLD